MLRKSWKRPTLSLGILFLIVISGLCYLSWNGMQKSEEPVKIYRVTQPTKKGVSDTTPPAPSAQTGTESASIPPEVLETADVASVSPSSDTMEVSAPSDELGRQNADVGSPIPQQNDEALAEERALQEIAELKTDTHRDEALVPELENQIEDLEASRRASEPRLRALAKALNALSAEEQRAYFEEPTPATKIISAFYEKLRSDAAAAGHSEETEQLIKLIQQDLPANTEKLIKRRIEALREYGFEPKF